MKNINSKLFLNNKIQIPQLGLGTYLSKPEDVVRAVKYAIKIGYRSIDTAALYQNEEGVGKAIRESEVTREKLFITSKVWNSDQGYDATLRAFDESLQKLGLEYLDLYLIHWPVEGKYVDTWRAMEQLYHNGKIRAIGVSNFLIHHLENLIAATDVVPAINQYEFHPYLQQRSLLEFCRNNDIQVEAWAPIMRGRAGTEPVLIDLGKKYGKSPEQIILRWDIQQNIITIPKSVHENRIRENAEIFDFELSDEDMSKINALDKNMRLGPDPDNFSF